MLSASVVSPLVPSRLHGGHSGSQCNEEGHHWLYNLLICDYKEGRLELDPRDRQWTFWKQGVLGAPDTPGLLHSAHCSPAKERQQGDGLVQMCEGEQAGHPAFFLTAPPTSHRAESLPLWLLQVLFPHARAEQAPGVGFTLCSPRSSRLYPHPPGSKAQHLGDDVMLYILDKLEVHTPSILKMDRIITLFWYSEDDSTFMNLCHQGVLAEAEKLLICLPPPTASILNTEANGFQRAGGEAASSLSLQGRGFMLNSGMAVTQTQRQSPQKEPLPVS